MKIRQHIPNFIDCRDEDIPQPIEINSLQELQELDFVNRWLKSADFFRLSMSSYGNSTEVLMCERHNGTKWYVLGFATEGSLASLGLPEWVKQ